MCAFTYERLIFSDAYEGFFLHSRFVWPPICMMALHACSLPHFLWSPEGCIPCICVLYTCVHVDLAMSVPLQLATSRAAA